MLYFNASVLKTPSSTSRISRRITLSRVVVFPTNVMRLTKNCCPSCIRIVTSTSGGPALSGLPSIGSGAFKAAGASGAFWLGSSRGLRSGYPVNS